MDPFWICTNPDSQSRLVHGLPASISNHLNRIHSPGSSENIFLNLKSDHDCFPFENCQYSSVVPAKSKALKYPKESCCAFHPLRALTSYHRVMLSGVLASTPGPCLESPSLFLHLWWHMQVSAQQRLLHWHASQHAAIRYLEVHSAPTVYPPKT